MAHDVFISHSTNNRPVANAVCAALESDGVRCWIAPRDVMPGRSYSGEITRAIQQSRAFVLIFSEHSNNSEQVLREVQLAANSRLHIVQFRIDAVVPSDDLEYYLSGPHWLDAVTPPLEAHLDQLKHSMKALLSLPRTGEGENERAPASPSAPVRPPPPPRPPSSQNISPSPAPAFAPAQPASNAWKIIALGIGVLAALGCVGLVIVFTLLRPQPPIAPTPPSNQTSAPQIVTAVPPAATTKAESTPLPRESVASTSVLSQAEAEQFVKKFNRAMERGDLEATMSFLDDSVDYYSFGVKPKNFIADQLRQYLAAVPVRAFVVGDVKMQPGPAPDVATIIYEARYSVRDVFGTQSSGRTRSEWDVARRSDGLKIIRTNWMTYPDPTPSH